MMQLIGSDGERYYSWDLPRGKYILGRSPDADFCVPNKTVSRKHAAIEVGESAETLYLTDLDSHNGTTVNGERVAGSVDVKIGDRLAFGQVEFKVVRAGESVEPESASTRSELTAADLEKSVVLPIDEALKPLVAPTADFPDVIAALSEMARMLVLSEPREVMLHRSLELVAKVIPAERLAILSTAEGGEGVTRVATFVPGGKDLGSFNLSRTIINDILKEKNAILIEDSQRDSRYARQESVIISGMKSAMAVPLFDYGKVHGILYADTTNPLHKYDDEFLRLLATFGNIIASRLQNYALLTERQERKVIEAELERAAMIQENLLTRSMPEIPGYQVHAFQEQSRLVGGDLYDLRFLLDGRLVFMVADVSGKGMGAALLMSDILASFRVLYHRRDFELLRAVELVSTELCEHSSYGDFATLFIGLLDPEAHTIRYVNAGHTFPLLVQKNGQLRYLESSGTMIGAFAGSSWEEQQAQIGEGDLLFVFTDGVTEAQRGDELYADERMERQVVAYCERSPQEIAGCLMEDIKEFADDATGTDDITMMIIKRVR